MLISLLRVKNEARWIAGVLDSVRGISDQIILMDDGSTDDTREIAAAHGATVLVSPFAGRGYIDESGDKNWLLAEARQRGVKAGDVCLMVDGDEELYQPDIPALLAAVQDGSFMCGATRIVYLWDRPDQMRVDRWYGHFTRPSVFRLSEAEMSFGNYRLHCSSSPLASIPLSQVRPLEVRLLHYGYMHKEDRIRKYHFYNSIDPHNFFEDQYRHMVIGDLFPAEASFRHAGPLELAPLSSL